MTNTQTPDDGRRDRVDDAVSWFTGRADQRGDGATDRADDVVAGSGDTRDAVATGDERDVAPSGSGASAVRNDTAPAHTAAADAGDREVGVVRSEDASLVGSGDVRAVDARESAAVPAETAAGSAVRTDEDVAVTDRKLHDTDGDGRVEVVEERLEAKPATDKALDDAGPDTEPYVPVDDEEPLVDTAGKPLYRDETAAATTAAGLTGARTERVVGADETAVLPVEEPVRTRKEDRAVRDRTLGKVERVPEQPAPVPYTTPTTYKSFPSLGLFLLRLVTGGLLGLRAYQHWASFDATQRMWASTILPSPGTMTWVMIAVEALLALMLVFGFATRVAGLALLVYAVALLVLVDWGAVSILQPGTVGLVGEMDLVLAVLGFFFFTTGGGRWGIDGSLHSNRIQKKNDKLFA